MLPRKSSKEASDYGGGGQFMNAVSLAFDKLSAGCPITDTAGRVVRRRNVSGFSLSENIYSEGLCLPKHRHSDAYLSFVLSGSYTEKYTDRECVCAAGALRFLPAGQLHEDEYNTEARCLLVRIEPPVFDRLGEYSRVLERPGDVQGIASAWLTTRMYQEFAAEDDVAPMAIEGVLLEILAESARTIGEKHRAHAPAWLRRVREALEDSYLLSPSLSELAAIGNVHPVHLSREFRKHYHSTIGEFIRKRRLERASELLTRSETPLSEIALLCGFSDQSHFCATFKSHTGLTPAKFRDMTTRV